MELSEPDLNEINSNPSESMGLHESTESAPTAENVKLNLSKVLAEQQEALARDATWLARVREKAADAITAMRVDSKLPHLNTN